MADTHVIKHGDTLPVFTAILYRDAALTQPVDLTNASGVKLKVGNSGEAPLLDVAMTIVAPATDGRVTYKFQLADWGTVSPGDYSVEIEVTWTGGDVSTYPREGYKNLRVEADLDLV